MTNNIITLRRLGDMGRWGNQILQYAGLKAFATENNCAFQCPPWLGDTVFQGVAHAPLKAKLPSYTEQYDADGCAKVPKAAELIGHDFHGWAQWHTSWWHGDRKNVLRELTMTNAWWDRMLPLIDALAGYCVVGVHIRRGDYGQGLPWDKITPTRWYLDWLDQHWGELRNPMLVVASEDTGLLKDFAKYNPQTVESLGIKLEAKPYPIYNYLDEDRRSGKAHLLDFLPEWFMLGECEYLLAANSTFSFTAAMLANCRHFYRPSQSTQGFVQEDVWNTWPLRRDCK